MTTSEDIRLISGDSARLNVSVSDGNGAPKQLGGASIRWALVSPGRAALIVEKSDPDGITITDAEAGEFTVQIDPEDTAGLSGRYRHESEVTDSYGNVSTVLSGAATITPDAIQ